MTTLRNIRRSMAAKRIHSARSNARTSLSRIRSSTRGRRLRTIAKLAKALALARAFLSPLKWERFRRMARSPSLRSGWWGGRRRPPLHKLAVGQGWFVDSFGGFEGGETLVDFVPVHYAPPRGEVFGTAVVVFQVIGVLPDVVAEDGIQALREGIVLIRRGDDLHIAVRLPGEPGPSGAELLRARI